MKNISKEVKRLQRQLNNICSVEGLTGEVYLDCYVYSTSGKEIIEEFNRILELINAPLGFNKSENQVWKHRALTIYISSKPIE